MWTRQSILASVTVSALLAACGSTSFEPPPPEPSLVVTPSSAQVPTGQAYQLRVSLANGQGFDFTPGDIVWASSQPTVATVAGGLVQASREGTAEISATWKGMSANATITVTAGGDDPPCAELAIASTGSSAASAAEATKPCRDPKPHPAK
jgi:uncharacterized protein YjdB